LKTNIGHSPLDTKAPKCYIPRIQKVTRGQGVERIGGKAMTGQFIRVPLRRGFTEIEILYKNVSGIGGIICGGYVRYCASPRYKPDPGGDVDIYCQDDSIFEQLKKHFSDMQLKKKHENGVALTYAHPESGPYFFSPPIQLIKPIREGSIVANGTMEEILSNFDFTVIRAGIVSPTEALVDVDFEKDEMVKELRIKNIHCPISSTLRCMKYSRKGYFLRPFQVLRLFLDWEARTPEYRVKIIEALNKLDSEGAKGFSQEEIEELEAMMRID
jgi:hypothetical protein